jgi:hypothetical protein
MLAPSAASRSLPGWNVEIYCAHQRGRGVYAIPLHAMSEERLNGGSRTERRPERLIPAAVGPLNRIPCFEGEGLSCLRLRARWTWKDRGQAEN